jgi:hypothetical protein
MNLIKIQIPAVKVFYTLLRAIGLVTNRSLRFLALASAGAFFDLYGGLL